MVGAQGVGDNCCVVLRCQRVQQALSQNVARVPRMHCIYRLLHPLFGTCACPPFWKQTTAEKQS